MEKKCEPTGYELFEEDKSEDTASSVPFDPSKISLQVRQPTIYNLMQRIKAEPPEINLQTFFQRRNDLWSEDTKAKLIESLLLRIPLPAFYFDGSNDENWLIVDGLQRLTVFDEFIRRKTLKLKELEYLKEFNGKGYDDLPRNMQRRIEETQITAYVIQPGTPENVKFNIFKRINTGGIPLSPQEIRFALHQGVASAFLDRLKDQEEYQKILCALKANRMEPQELILRFLTFYMLGHQAYEPDMDSFLNKGMDKLDKSTEKERTSWEQKFTISMRRNWQLFEDRAFRKLSRQDGKIRRGPLNKALFEIWSTVMADISEEEFAFLCGEKDAFLQHYLGLLETDIRFVQSVSYGTSRKESVNKRFETLQDFIKKEIRNDSAAKNAAI